MKNTICEKLMWNAMTPTIFQYIEKNYKGIDIKQMKNDAKKIIKKWLRELLISVVF